MRFADEEFQSAFWDHSCCLLVHHPPTKHDTGCVNVCVGFLKLLFRHWFFYTLMEARSTKSVELLHCVSMIQMHLLLCRIARGCQHVRVYLQGQLHCGAGWVHGSHTVELGFLHVRSRYRTEFGDVRLYQGWCKSVDMRQELEVDPSSFSQF